MLDAAFSGDHIDAVDRAGLDAEIAAGAFIDNHRVHQLGSTQNRIDRTRLDTLGAANTLVLADVGNGWFGFDSVFCIKRLGLNIE